MAETAGAIEAHGVETTRVTCDVTEPASLTRVRETFGGVDVVVASQGAISRERVTSIEESDWDRVTDVALDGVWRVTKHPVPAMDNGGVVVNISSPAARLAMVDLPAYAAAKGGVESFTRAAAKELAPGFVITPQNEETYAVGTEKRTRIDERTPLGRVAEREEMVEAAVFLNKLLPPAEWYSSASAFEMAAPTWALAIVPIGEETLRIATET